MDLNAVLDPVIEAQMYLSCSSLFDLYFYVVRRETHLNASPVTDMTIPTHPPSNPNFVVEVKGLCTIKAFLDPLSKSKFQSFKERLNLLVFPKPDHIQYSCI